MDERVQAMFYRLLNQRYKDDPLLRMTATLVLEDCIMGYEYLSCVQDTEGANKVWANIERLCNDT